MKSSFSISQPIYMSHQNILQNWEFRNRLMKEIVYTKRNSISGFNQFRLLLIFPLFSGWKTLVKPENSFHPLSADMINRNTVPKADLGLYFKTFLFKEQQRRKISFQVYFLSHQQISVLSLVLP